ncbi:hypothetical protein GCM10023160_09160 [Brachybacterium paraconglomeratum]|uniref:hypothetical protein n=1 Tax=Brachybacterium paraconglomeratum TaxID=173362 RepID=UPI0031EA4FB8
MQDRREAAQLLKQRREHYERWEKALTDGTKSWERASRMRNFLQEIEDRAGPESADFVAWSRAFIDQLDPVEGFQSPEGEVPDLSHAEAERLRNTPAPTVFDLWRTEQ